MRRLLPVALLALIAATPSCYTTHHPWSLAADPDCPRVISRGDEPSPRWWTLPDVLAPHEPGEVAVVPLGRRARDDAPTMALRERMRALSDLWRRGLSAEASALLRASTRAIAWDDASGEVFCSASFHESDGCRRLSVTVSREKAEGPLAVAFPPGIYGTAPRVQNLALLRAATVVLAPEQAQARIEFPIACASFHSGAPGRDDEYELRPYPPGSPMARLLAVICAGPPASETAPTQLAVWIAANRVTIEEVDSERPCTFEDSRRVDRYDAPEAESLLRAAGLDARGDFLAPAPPAPEARPVRAPAPIPAPTAPPPTPAPRIEAQRQERAGRSA